MNYQDQQAAMLQSIEDGFKAGASPSTLVSMSQDYTQEPAGCLSNVVFVPELFDHPDCQRLLKELAKVDSSQYIYPRASVHTTIKNVRTIHYPPLFAEADIERARPALRAVAAKYAPFDIEWRGLLELPTSLAVKGFSLERYSRLVGDLHQALIDAGVPDNKTYASQSIFAHISTLCRYTHEPSLAWNEVIKLWKNTSFGVSHIQSFSLIVCSSAVHPSSLRIVETFPLSG